MRARQTTGRGLSADEAFIGLLDYGLFAEKLPPCFMTEGLAALTPKPMLRIVTLKDEKRLKNLLEKQVRGYARYQTMRDVNIPRYLGIPHPQSYTAQCLVIRRYWEKIKNHCGKPMVPVSRIFVRRTQSDRVFEMNYKGSEHFDLEERDLAFLAGAEFVVHADISTCFPSIYTHSIPWALHGKKHAKKSHGSLTLAGNVLDKATQALRDRQTNGLLIGPHTSNILSELILTTVDSVLLKKKYTRLFRHIDDYRYFARSYVEAENFIRDLGLALRDYELVLNAKKTRILSSPRPQVENWVRELSLFQFPAGEITFSSVRNFLDLALHHAHESGTSAALNYAIKMVPARLNERCKRLFTQEAANLALSYPYLAPLMDEHIFTKHNHPSLGSTITGYATSLLGIGIKRIFPDAIAHALYLAIKYKFELPQSEATLRQIVAVDDCVCHVLLLEYARVRSLKKVRSAIMARANNLKGLDVRDQDAFWLLLYQAWPETDLRGNGQEYLAALKAADFQFVRFGP